MVSVAHSLCRGFISHHGTLIVCSLTFLEQAKAAMNISAYDTVLVLAGTELTLFLVAGTVLCFGFSVRMMLITL